MSAAGSAVCAVVVAAACSLFGEGGLLSAARSPGGRRLFAVRNTCVWWPYCRLISADVIFFPMPGSRLITLRISESLYHELVEEAIARDVTVSELVRLAIAHFVRKHSKRKAKKG